MEVSPNRPADVAYVLHYHPVLGYLVSAYVIQLTGNGNFSMQYARLTPAKAQSFSSLLDETDLFLIDICERLTQNELAKRLLKLGYKEPIHKLLAANSQTKRSDNETRALESLISHVENLKKQLFPKLLGKNIFQMGKNQTINYQPIQLAEEKASIIFHVKRNEKGILYYPTLKLEEQRIEIMKDPGDALVAMSPAWVLHKNTLFTFENEVEGKKLKPFFNKKFIHIQPSSEREFFTKFFPSILENYEVFVRGIWVDYVDKDLQLLLKVKDLPSVSQASLFGSDEVKSASKFVISLYAKYGDMEFDLSMEQTPFFTKADFSSEPYTFLCLKRDLNFENHLLALLIKEGLAIRFGRLSLSKQEFLDWYASHQQWLEAQPIAIEFPLSETTGRKYFTGKSSIELTVKEKQDWFDLAVKVRFGDQEVPFHRIQRMIQNGKNEIKLPDGSIAIIPQEWFTKYEDIFSSATEGEDGSIQLASHHLALVQELMHDKNVRAELKEKFKKLLDFQRIEEVPLSPLLHCDLREYQKLGYHWLMFLQNYQLGGCLADDMGLGKTVQTIAFLLKTIEQNPKSVSLLVLPTSLLFNWKRELDKFAPSLKYAFYHGVDKKNWEEKIQTKQLIITSYGMIRQEPERFAAVPFLCCVLDEAQSIKNPDSLAYKALMQVNAKHKLTLSGTPIENSLMDLWAQMNFLNPGLLGTRAYFKKHWQSPIEKKSSQYLAERLKKITAPFVLRREKAQVAKDLPDKIEQELYCEMEPDQLSKYEEYKSAFRNKIVETIDTFIPASQSMFVLQGLMHLRQLALHPKLVDPEYTGGSGKIESLKLMLRLSLDNKRKILIFSSFVKFLEIVRSLLEEMEVDYCYLDGSTRDRQAQVDDFQQNPSKKVFLLSIKAGGVGLNLTAAENVFILDPWWNPAVEQQAIDRAYRIGQKNQVFAYKFLSSNSLEEKIQKIKQRKKQLANAIIETEEDFSQQLSREDLLELLG